MLNSIFGKKETQTPASDLRKIYDLYSDQFKKFFHEDQAKYPDKKGMEVKYIDGKGQAYYRLEQFTLQPPLERIGIAQDIMLMMARGLDDSEMQMLIDAANDELALAYAGKKNRAPVVVGAIFKEMENRKNLLLHINLLYEYLAVFTIREDEEIGSFNRDIHDEKVKQFKEDNRGKNSFFFFQIPELKRVHEALKSSELEWMKHCEESQRQINALKTWVANIGSGAKKSEQTSKTATST